MFVTQRVAQWVGKSYFSGWLWHHRQQVDLFRPQHLDKFKPSSGRSTTGGGPLVSSSRSLSLTNCHRQQNDYDDENKRLQPLPRIWYVHKPFDWLRYKMDFRHLRTRWDPNFSETDFTRGARQAISMLSQLISKNMYDAMRPLLTRSAMVNLRRDIEILWTDEVRRNIALTSADIQLVIPIKVYLRKIEEVDLGPDKRLCDVDLVFIGMKYLQTHRTTNPVIAFIDIIARNYSDGVPPEWTVASFKLRKFNLLRSRAA